MFVLEGPSGAESFYYIRDPANNVVSEISDLRHRQWLLWLCKGKRKDCAPFLNPSQFQSAFFINNQGFWPGRNDCPPRIASACRFTASCVDWQMRIRSGTLIAPDRTPGPCIRSFSRGLIRCVVIELAHLPTEKCGQPPARSHGTAIRNLLTT